ncbi:MAG: hypothetical protein R3F29_03380 [Planctomycetota bacterium]
MPSMRPLLAIPFLAGFAAAQVNPFVFYPQDPERQALTCTSFVGRPDVANAGEALMEVDTDHFRSVGDANGPVMLFGVYNWIADEKLSTVETYDLVVRAADAAGPGPDTTAAGELLRIVGLTTPPSTNPNRGTWIAYDGFASGTPLVVLPGFTPQLGRYYVGVGLPANPLWPATDGHSLFRADLLNAGTGATVGENHRVGAPDPTWAVRPNGTKFSTPWSYVLGPLVTSPNLHIGGIDPTSSRLGAPGANLSMNGLYPDISGQPRSDGLMFRVTDNLAPFGLVLLGGSFGFQPAYFEFGLIGTLIGHCHVLQAGGVVPLGFTSLVNGARDIQIATPGSLSPTLMGADVAFQAIVWDTNINLAEWTNAQEVHL